MQALARRGLGGAEVEPIIPAWGEERRRASGAYRGADEGQVKVGSSAAAPS
ncbi:MAG: hypothetical protein R3C16_13375 [Hyphomonadaceae bacterium]